MKKYIYTAMITLLLVGAAIVPSTQAATTSNEAMLEQIKMLMAKVEELQKQLSTIRGEVKSLIKDGLEEGMTDADISKLQELLATDPTIYPEGKKTGYFGPLTKKALERFQARHGLAITGKVDSETRDMLEEYLHEGFGGKIPEGLLKAPGISKKMEDRFNLRCDKLEGSDKGMGPLCKKWKMEHGDDDSDEDVNDEDEDEMNDEDENDGEFDLEVEIEDGETTVEFTFDGEDYDVTVDSTELDEVLDAVADAIDEGDDASDLDNDLSNAIEAALEDAEDESAESDADKAIEDASDAIDEARKEADDADNEEAGDKVDDADDVLEDALEAFEDKDYEEAKDLAEEAEDLADEAMDILDDEETL